MNWLKFKLKINSYEYIRHHWRIMMRYMTLRRVINLFVNYIEYLLRREKLWSYSPYIKVDPSLTCQLRCPGCPQSREEFRENLPAKSFLTLEEFKKILKPIAETTFGISLSMYGEPLLNKDITSMIEYAHSLNVGVWFPTNFSLKVTDEQLERLVKSGLDKLVISLDGTSEETYKEYRVNGKFEIVKKNVQRLANIKKRYGSPTPHLEWKFIMFDHNLHEVDIVKREYRKWGFDSCFILPDRRWDEVKAVQETSYAKKKNCFWLFNTINVAVDGSLMACCANMPAWNIGNAIESDIRTLWNNDRYRKLRRGFSRLNYGQEMGPVCVKCFGGDPKK
ncbi:MAG: radical SAM protein [Colwellia sp.]|nr:radical SAM protein [Colwellia sp.]